MSFCTPNRTTDLTRTLILRLSSRIKYAVDMTCGNGNDSLYILNAIEGAKLLALDLQREAVDRTIALLSSNHPTRNWKVLQRDHSEISEISKDPADLYIYNLGYLPGGDKTIITRPESTVQSLRAVTSGLLTPGGAILLTHYVGHDGGPEELHAVEEYVKTLDQKEFNVLKYEFLNQVHSPPLVLSIERSM